MRVAVVTAGSPDYAELSALTTPTKQRYCDKHKYDFFYYETEKRCEIAREYVERLGLLP